MPTHDQDGYHYSPDAANVGNLFQPEDPTNASEVASDAEAAAAAGAISTAIALASGNGAKPMKVGASQLAGACVFQQLSGGQWFPCAGITLVVTNARGDEIGRENTAGDGWFSFFVDPGHPYFIRPLSAKYTMKTSRALPIQPGERFDLFLTLKK